MSAPYERKNIWEPLLATRQTARRIYPSAHIAIHPGIRLYRISVENTPRRTRKEDRRSDLRLAIPREIEMQNIAANIISRAHVLLLPRKLRVNPLLPITGFVLTLSRENGRESVLGREEGVGGEGKGREGDRGQGTGFFCASPLFAARIYGHGSAT